MSVTHYSPDTYVSVCGTWEYPDLLSTSRTATDCAQCLAIIAAGDAPAPRDMSMFTAALATAGADLDHPQTDVVEHRPGFECDLGTTHTGVCIINGTAL